MTSKFAKAIAIALVFGLGSSVMAAPKSTESKPVEDLGDALLGDLLKPSDSSDGEGDAPAKQPSLLPGIDQLRKLLDPPAKQPEGEDLGKSSQSPLVTISNRMVHAKQLIAKQTLTGETQDVQQAIVSDIDKLIEQLNKKCKSCSKSGQCDKPGQKTQASKPKPGQGKQQAKSTSATQAAQQSKASADGTKDAQPGDAADVDLVKKLWGQLPEKMREQLLQSSSDEFLPKYREELEEYFRRLSQQDRNEP